MMGSLKPHSVTCLTSQPTGHPQCPASDSGHTRKSHTCHSHITAHTRTRLRHGHKRAYTGLSPGLHTPCQHCGSDGLPHRARRLPLGTRRLSGFRAITRENPGIKVLFQRLHRGCGKCSSRAEKPVCREGARARARHRARGAHGLKHRAAETLGRYSPRGSTQAQTAGQLSKVRLVGLREAEEAGDGGTRGECRGERREPGLRKAGKEEGTWAKKAGEEGESLGPTESEEGSENLSKRRNQDPGPRNAEEGIGSPGRGAP